MRADGSWGNRGGTRAGAPSVCVNLSSDHTHDFLLYLGVLSINVGIAHLTILIYKEEPCADMVGHRAHPDVPMLLEVLGCNHWEERGQKL